MSLLRFLLIVGAAIFAISYLGSPSQPTTTAPPISLEEMRENATSIPYDELARYPDKYKGTPVRYRGQVLQKISDTTFRIGVRESLAIWSDAIYMRLQGDARKERLLENDIVEFVGIAQGERSYRAVLGNRVTIPEVHAYEVRVVRPRGQ